MAAVLADDDCCEGGDLNVMSEESSENCVSGVCGLCGFARAEANDHVIRWQHTYLHVVWIQMVRKRSEKITIG